MEAVNQTRAAPASAGVGMSNPAEGVFHETRTGWLVLALIWAASVAYLAAHLRQGWAPPDAGTLAQMAERVLHGQVPDLNYIEEYTGGLTYLNALALRLFGMNFFSLRIPLFLFFIGWVPSVYLVARRFARPLTAGLVTLLAVAWSVPEYPEAMPSWYNLFFATWGVLALLRYTENRKARWLGIAGFCGGLSFLVKISGLYFVAAALLFLVFYEQALDESSETEPKHYAPLYRLFVTGGLLLFLALLTNLISWIPAVSDYVHFVLPSACLVALLLWAAWRKKSGPGIRRFRRLLGMGLPFAGGFLVPISLFLFWLAEKGALGVWFEGTFVRPTLRMQWTGGPPTPLAIAVGLLPGILIVLLAFDSRPSSRRLARLASPFALAGLLFAAWKWPSVYLLLGFSLPLLVPLAALAALAVLRGSAGLRRQKVFLVVAAAVLCALVQFPAPAAIYFNYAAPLVILALLALVSTRPNYDRVAIGSLLAFYLVFALWLRTPGYWFEMRAQPGSMLALRKLDLARAGGIRVKASEAEQYEKLIPVVQAHARGAYIYCTDSPEVYFLSRKRNPTPSINELFLAPDFLFAPIRTERILDSVKNHGVSVVVFNNGPLVQSGPLPAALRAALDAQFPLHETVGDFEVRWRSGSRNAPTAGTTSGYSPPSALTAHAP